MRWHTTTGLRGPEWDAEVIGDLGNGHPEGVVEDEDCPLLRRQAPEPPIELIAVVDRRVLVGRSRAVHLEQDDIGRVPPVTPGLGVAGVDENPVEPRLESIEVAEGGSSRQTVTSAACTASSARPKSRRIRCAMNMQRSPTARTRAPKASSSPCLA